MNSMPNSAAMNNPFGTRKLSLRTILTFLILSVSLGNLYSQTYTELVIPKYMGSKTASGTNNARTPVVFCVSISGLTASTIYDVKAGLGLTTDAITSYGAGNIWDGAAFSGSSQLNAFTTNASGNSGPVWIFIQPTGSSTRFGAGAVHNLRLAVTVSGGSFPSSPAYITTKTCTSLDIATTALSTTTTDDGAFVAGSALPVSGGKYVLLFDNTAGTGDPLFAYQIRQAAPTNTTQSELPAVVNNIYLQAGTSAVGDYPAVIPIGANNPNGVRRFESRSADNTVFASNTDADGIWPSGANTTTVARREVVTITNTDAPLAPVIPAITVNSPVAGNQWKQASAHLISWSASNTNANVKIEFTDNASAGTPTWTTLNASVAASAGSWNWSIPAGQALSNDCKIRITDIPLTATGLSGIFSIIPQPTAVATIAALRAGTVGTEYFLTTEAVLSFQQTSRNQKFIQDATAAILIDDVSGTITTTYTIGDGITGIIGKLFQNSNGMMNFIPTENAPVASSSGNVLTPELISIADLTANFESYESELIRINYCTFADAGSIFAVSTSYPVTDLAGTAGKFRTTFPNVDYIGQTIPAGYQDVVGIANSTSSANSFITSRNRADIFNSVPSVSYTHLTLPTIYSV